MGQLTAHPAPDATLPHGAEQAAVAVRKRCNQHTRRCWATVGILEVEAMAHPLTAYERRLIDEIECALKATDPRLQRMLGRRTKPVRLWIWQPRRLAALASLAAVLVLAAATLACTVTPWAAVAAVLGAIALAIAFRRLAGLHL
ncbi:hypothetical protein KCMC57_up58310 [Kitasatospora sp. CMC57]|uniref:DUF3040 domain-containing protein n=1 Tax=Kitasatospora sp. CMC57 TaxID=3231513 RepID=A0AB33KDF9_9ACTN